MSSVEPLQSHYFHREQTAQGCFHCGLALPDHIRFTGSIEGITRQFCCPSCQSVCNAIHDSGLQGFYRRTPTGAVLAPPPVSLKDAALYDIDEVQAEFVSSLQRERDIHLLVEGIHCAACVWLIEHSLAQMTGVLKAHVNLSGKRLKVRWDNSKIALSKIIAHLGKIGYTAVPFDPEIAEGQLKKQNRALLFRMAFAAFAMMNLMWISIALYSGANNTEFQQLLHWAGFALATPTLLYSGYPFFYNAWTGLKRLHLSMDLPISIGALSTYCYSVYVTWSQSAVADVYFDTVVNFIFVILVGRYLEAISKRQAVVSTQRLLDLQPRGATVLRGGEEHILPIRAISAGDVVLIKPGDHIPVDGTIIEGRSSVDESMLSGESKPVFKSKGESVSAGTMNLDSALMVTVCGTLRNTSLGKIIQLVEDAQTSKAPIQRVADRIVPWFVAITLLLAISTFSWWLTAGFETALMTATAVLIITCPCAFGLATPMAIASASGLGARYGILIKNSAVLETLSRIDHMVFDKTGTLTQGRMQVQEIIVSNNEDNTQSKAQQVLAPDRLLAQVAAVERYSEHSIAKAITTACKSQGLMPMEAQQVLNKPGYGVKGIVADGVNVVVGTENWLLENNVTIDERFKTQQQQWEARGASCVHVGIDAKAVGLIAITDQLRSGAKVLISALQANGMQTTILSGDRRVVVEGIAKELGGMASIAQVLPQQKDQVIQQLRQHGSKVAMVGDGINDAPALARADVGIALGSGTDVSGGSADIVLLSDDINKLQLAIKLARRTLRTIHQNIGISIVYNIIMVPLAMAGFITPLVAAIAMPISSLLVIGNAARIRTLFRGETV
ncbi:MAG: heavy metal translocating P-type ATPase [Gammaproteobacteria bacterium]|nr:heavy metal translocating P-type ATPase [Gammaproteobacteria bacterium]